MPLSVGDAGACRYQGYTSKLVMRVRVCTRLGECPPLHHPQLLCIPRIAQSLKDQSAALSPVLARFLSLNACDRCDVQTRRLHTIRYRAHIRMTTDQHNSSHTHPQKKQQRQTNIQQHSRVGMHARATCA